MAFAYEFGPHRLDPQRGTLTIRGTPVALQPLTWTLLLAMVERPRKLFTREDLCALLWPDLTVVSDESVTKVVSRLRAALDEPTISTVRGRGYRFDVDVKKLPATSSGNPPRLPAEVTPLLGRQALIDDVLERLEGGHRLVTLCGQGGVGKTRLAVCMAHRLEAAGEAVTFVDARATASQDDLVRVVGAALRVRAATGADVASALALRGPQVLVLDNLEQVADAAAEVVTSWLAEADAVRVLVTSRKPLHAPGEWVREVPPLGDTDGVALLVDRAGVSADMPGVGALAGQLGGLPLAIELAAAQLRRMPAEALLRRLDPGLTQLRAAGRAQDDRHRTLTEVLRWSWDLLDPSAQRACAMLTVFEGAFTLDAAEAVLPEPLGAP
ncbi:MAG: winged helix-turn-helix domain-containing protein, partial [Myxococcota bacterium]